jgi:hypothetical protein
MAKIDEKKLAEVKKRLRDALQEAELVKKDLENSKRTLERRVDEALR